MNGYCRFDTLSFNTCLDYESGQLNTELEKLVSLNQLVLSFLNSVID